MTQDEERTPDSAAVPWLNEDWAATIVGLVLIALALVGVITKAMVP